MGSKEQHILDSLSQVADDHGVEIVAVEALGSRKSPIVRIYIDTPSGVSFQVLSEAQEWIGQVLDEIDPYPGAYTMEVSSPGIDRPLRTPEHFKRFEGEQAKVSLKTPIGGRANFKGTISSVSDDGIELEYEGNSLAIGYDDIKRANLIGKIEFN